MTYSCHENLLAEMTCNAMGRIVLEYRYYIGIQKYETSTIHQICFTNRTDSCFKVVF